MKHKYRLLFAFFFLFITGMMKAQMKADFIAKVTGPKVDFENYTASNPASSSLTYRWDFGDSTGYYYTNTTTKFKHTYNHLGNYKVTLIATDTTGTFPTDTFSDYVDIICIANFTYNTSGKTGFFYDASAIDTTKVTSNKVDYFWIYSDSNNITKQGKNDIHTFPGTGTYTVKHIVYDGTTGSSCKDTSQQTLFINYTPCKAAFGYFSNGNKNFDFKADSLIGIHSMFWWSFGDGTFSTQRNPNHSFNANGTYRVSMHFYDSALNCGDSIYHLVNVGNNNCQAKFGYSINGKNANFYDSSTIINSSATKYFWYFDNSVTSTLQNPTQSFLKNKDYLVSLTITDTVNNCTSTYADTLKIGPNCRPDFNYSIHPTNNFKFYYNDNSVVPSANTLYTWSTGSSNKNDSITYGVIGNYALCLNIKDSAKGCNETVCKAITVVENCNARFKYTITGDSVTATADTNTAFMYHIWNAKGNTYSGSSINVKFAYGTNNIICHQIIDSAKGCVSSWCDSVKIGCNNDFTYTVSGDSVQFAGSQVTSGATYLWHFGDGDTSVLQNPLHIYSVSDTVYQVNLTFKNNLGCTGSINKNIVIGNPKQDIMVNYTKGIHSNDVYAARIYLIQHDSASQILTAIDSADVFSPPSDSVYYFRKVAAGNYLVKIALLPSDSDYNDYFPTYSTMSLTWSNANIINHTNQYFSMANIYMVQGTNPGGSGFIAGYVYQGANKKEGVLENIDVYLTLKDGTPVTFAKTDVEGKYEFNNLAFGEYKLWVEIVGKPSEFYDITLNQNTPSSMDINFDVNEDAIVKRINASVNTIQNNNLKLYPNPVNDFLTISLEENTSNIDVEVYDINGSLVIKNKMRNGEKLDVSNIKTGIYYIQIQTESTTIFRQKFLKD